MRPIKPNATLASVKPLSRKLKSSGKKLFFFSKQTFPMRWWIFTFPRLRLTHQLVGFFVLVVLVPLLLISYNIYNTNQKAVKKQVAQFTIHTAEATYQALRLEMAWQENQAQMAAAYWQTLLKSLSDKQRQRMMAAFFKTNPDYESVAVYNAEGRRILLFLSPNRRVEMLPPTKVFDSPRVNDVKFSLDYEPARGKNKTLSYRLEVRVTGPGSNPSGQPGTIVFTKRFPFLNTLIREHTGTFHEGFVMVDQEGTIVAGPPKLISRKLPPEDWGVMQSLNEGVIREFEHQSAAETLQGRSAARPDDTLLDRVFIRVPRLGWGLVLESPYHIQRTYILRARTQSMALVLLCIVIITILGLLYTRAINRNFRQLLKGIKAMSEGRYSRKIRLITRTWTPFEVVVLTAEFNRMATKISSAWANIQTLNQELVYKNQQDMFIAQATQRLHGSLEIDEVCRTAVSVLSERPGHLAVWIFLPQKDSGYALIAHSGDASHLSEAVTASVNDPGTPIPAGLPQNTRLSFQPITYQWQAVGFLALLRSSDPSVTASDDTLLLNLLTNQIGVAIYQARQWQQLQQANKQLAKLDELRSNLIDTVSHELRTPLTNIKGYTSRLIRYENTLDSATKVKSLKVIKQQADRLSRLVEDLLVIPDLEQAEGIRIFPDRVAVRSLVNRCVGFIQEKAGHHALQVYPIDDALEILVDPDRMEQVLLNLLDNALKYAGEEDAVIEVRVTPVSGNQVEISVFNPCDPISDEDIASLFTKFKRLDERLTRTTRGTGLGLFITKGLVEAMGGSIALKWDQGFWATLTFALCSQSDGSEAPDSPKSNHSVDEEALYARGS